MADVDLDEVRAGLRARGYAVAHGTIEEVKRAAAIRESLTLLRSGQEASDKLRPMTREEAPERSLSAIVGLDAQPLHTDGAHLLTPPDLIVLHSATPTPTGTAVWTPFGIAAGRLPDHVRVGVFSVRANGLSFLATAWEPPRLRYDPGCMAPADDQAKETRMFFDEARSLAHVHLWEEPDTLLFIDNRRALHAREAVTDDVDTRQIDRLAFRLEAAQ